MNTFDINGKVVFQYKYYMPVLRKMQAMPLLRWHEAVAEFCDNSESACGLLTGKCAGKEHCPLTIDGDTRLCEAIQTLDLIHDQYGNEGTEHLKEMWVDCIIEINRKMRKEHKVRAGEIIYRTFK